MKITYEKLLNVYPSLLELKKFKMEYSKAKAIFNLYKKLENEFEFYRETEEKLVNTYAHKDPNGKPMIKANGQIVFANKSEGDEYLKEINDIRIKEIDIDISEIKLCVIDLDNHMISPELIESLEGIIVFD